MMMKLKAMVVSGLAALAATFAPAAETIDPRGPVEYPGMKAAADAQGVQAQGYTFRNECRKPSPWQAEWIWLGGNQNAAVATFRKEITLAAAPRQVKAWLTADVKYRLYINGRLVSRGPVDMGRDYAGGETRRWFYDYRDLTAYFTVGKNVIAAEVFQHWPGGDSISRGRPGFLFEAEVVLPEQVTLTVKSDASWRAIPAAQFPNPNTYDAGKEPAGWRLPGFDDSAWPACRPLQDRWAPLVASEMPPLMEARYPVLRIEGLPSRTITTDGSFRVVFDRVLSAYPTLKVKGGRGAVMTIHAQIQATVVLDEGEQYFEFPYMTEIVPAFTVELKNVKSPIEIVDVGRELHFAAAGVPRGLRVQRRALEPPLEGLPLDRADLPADAPPRFAQPPGTDLRPGRLRDRGHGEQLRLRPAVAHAAGCPQIRLAAERREVS